MVQLFIDGGGFMWPILFIFIIGFVFVIERLYHLFKGLSSNEDFAYEVAETVKQSGIDSAKTQCEGAVGPVANLCLSALERADKGSDEASVALESVGSIETVGSYDTLNYTTEIPYVIDNRASDFIDLRPRVSSPYSGNASPFTFSNRDFTGSKTEALVSNKSIIVDYSHYLGRIDRLYVNKDSTFSVKKGVPAVKQVKP